MDRDAETATYEATPGESSEAKPGARRPAPLQVRDPGRYEIIAEHGMIQISSATTGALLRTIAGPTRGDQLDNRAINTIAFSPDGKRLLATGIGYALLWNAELDPRNPAEAAAVVAAKSPWRLVDGRLVRASDSAPTASR
jgi:hypothetical protein